MTALAENNFNLSSKFSSYIGLKDLIDHPDGTFESLFSSPAKTTTTIKDHKLIDLLLRGFTLNSRVQGGFEEASAHSLISKFVENFVPGYLQSIITQILKFKDSTATINSLGSTLCPPNLPEDKKVTKVSLDNFRSKVQEKLSGNTSHFADVLDLSDILGKEISDLVNLGGVFVNECVEGVLALATDDIEIGIFSWDCHVELGVQINGTMELLNALYYRMK